MHGYLLPSFALDLTPAYLDSTLAGDARQALRLVIEQGLGAGVSASELELRLIVPAQREIGRLWQENTITVAQEHLATSISQLVLSRLYPHLARAAANGKRVLVACVEGEMHDLGARMGADFLEVVGFDVRFLGADVSCDRLRSALDAERPDLLGLSATIHSHLPALRQAVQTARALFPTLPIVVGGGIFERRAGLASELGVQASGSSADELADTCRRLLDC
jgi:MerR family transcriptional regulator, light-induced transcriptional regulator